MCCFLFVCGRCGPLLIPDVLILFLCTIGPAWALSKSNFGVAADPFDNIRSSRWLSWHDPKILHSNTPPARNPPKSKSVKHRGEYWCAFKGVWNRNRNLSCQLAYQRYRKRIVQSIRIIKFSCRLCSPVFYFPEGLSDLSMILAQRQDIWKTCCSLHHLLNIHMWLLSVWIQYLCCEMNRCFDTPRPSGEPEEGGIRVS